jgi:hypothetical protein
MTIRKMDAPAHLPSKPKEIAALGPSPQKKMMIQPGIYWMRLALPNAQMIARNRPHSELFEKASLPRKSLFSGSMDLHQ